MASFMTPEFCFSTGYLKKFLQSSRALDDGITRYLNTLLLQHPKRDLHASSSPVFRNLINIDQKFRNNKCREFKQQLLFPSWQARDEVLEYCNSVATNITTADTQLKSNDEEFGKNVEMDPYFGRLPPTLTTAETLAVVVREEKQVEKIVRTRTWTVMNDRCGRQSASWEQTLNEWKRDKSNEWIQTGLDTSMSQ